MRTRQRAYATAVKARRTRRFRGGRFEESAEPRFGTRHAFVQELHRAGVPEARLFGGSASAIATRWRRRHADSRPRDQDHWCRIWTAAARLSKLVWLARERGKRRIEDLVWAQLRRENALHHQSLNQRMQHTHEMIGWHRKLARVECPQPFGADVVAALRDLMDARTEVGSLQRVGETSQSSDRCGCALLDDGECGLRHRAHGIRERRTGFELRPNRRPVGLTERDEELVAILEVSVNRSGRHAGTLRHFLDRGPLVALLADQPAGGLEQRGARPFAFVPFRLAAPGGRMCSCHSLKIVKLFNKFNMANSKNTGKALETVI